MGWFKDLKKTLGFSAPDPLPGPVVDQSKKGLTDSMGQQLAYDFNNAQRNYNNPGYTAPEKAQEIQTQKAVIPTAQSATVSSIAAYRPGAAQPQQPSQPANMVFVPPSGPGQMGTWKSTVPESVSTQAPAKDIAEAARTIPISNEAGQKLDLAQPNALQAEAVKRALGNTVSSITGYDPAMKTAALEQVNREAATAQGEATNQAKEILSRSGILNSSVGAGKLGQIVADISGKKMSAINDINAKDIEAQREDRYRNANLTADNISQLSNLGQSGQNMALSAGSFERQGRQQDIATQTAAEEFKRTGNQIDSAEALKRAEFARQSGQIDSAEAWKRYAAEQDANATTADEKRRVQTQNINAADLGNVRKEDQYNNLLKLIQSYTSGSPYTPESEAAALAAQQQKQEQQSRLSSTMGLLTAFI